MSLVCLYCTSFHIRGPQVTHSKLVQWVAENFGDKYPAVCRAWWDCCRNPKAKWLRRQMGIVVMKRNWCLLQGFREKSIAELSLWIVASNQRNSQWNPNLKRNGPKWTWKKTCLSKNLEYTSRTVTTTMLMLLFLTYTNFYQTFFHSLRWFVAKSWHALERM